MRVAQIAATRRARKGEPVKRYLIIAGLLLGLSSVANAKPYSGPYMGVDGGVDNYELSAKEDLAPLFPGYTASFDGLSGNGGYGEIYLGYHQAVNKGFVAIEGFAGFSGAKIEASITDGTATALVKAQARESFGIAAHAGFRLNTSTGLYARLGWIHTKFKSTFDDSVDVFTDSRTEDAVQYGGGIETMIGPKLALRAEYVMANYGDVGLGSGVTVDSGGFRAGLTFRY